MAKPPMTGGEAFRDATLQELRAQALEPLIEMIAESLAKDDETSVALLAWLESLDGSDALRSLQRKIIDAYFEYRGRDS